MGDNKFTVIFVIQGKEFPIEVVENQSIIAGVQKALKESGNPGSHNDWQLRTEDGKELDMNSKYSEYDIEDQAKLFLSKGAGRGGN